MSKTFNFGFEPRYFSSIESVTRNLGDLIHSNLKIIGEVEGILGLTIIRYDGKQPLVFSADDTQFDYLKTLGETIASMEPVSYFRDLSGNFEYRGLGHLSFDEFDLYIVKIAKDLLLTVMLSDSTNKLFKVCQDFADALFNELRTTQVETFDSSLPETVTYNNESEEGGTFNRYDQQADPKPKKDKSLSKTDLKKLLRDKLDVMDPSDK